MADDLSLLFKIRGDAAGATKAASDTRAAIATLKTHVGSDFHAMQTASKSALQSIGDNLNVFISQRIPLIGGAFIRITENLKGLGTTATATGAQLGEAAAGAQAAGAGVAGMAGPIGIAVVAVAALAVGAGALVKQLFDLAKGAADFRGKLFDLSQQTGVSVETLSALEVVAKTTGGSIESIAQSLVIFQGKLDDAQDASSETGKKFEELGISTNNTEDAFRDALRVLAAMPEGFHQTNEAAELFGRRGGKQVLAILKELGGDLDGAIAKLKELGVVVSTEDAKAADEFNDQLAILQFQFRALLGKEVIPGMLSALKDISQTLKDNKEAVQLLGQALGGIATIIGTAVKGQLIVLQQLWEIHEPIVSRVAEAYERLSAALNVVLGTVANSSLGSLALGGIGRVGGSGITKEGTGDFGGGEAGALSTAAHQPAREKGKGGGGKKKRDTRLQDAIAEAALAEREALLLNAEDVAANKRELDDQLKDIQDFTARALALADDRQDAEIVRINTEQDALDLAFARKLISQREYNAKSRDLTIQNTEANQTNTEERFRLEQTRDRQIAAAEQSARERQLRIAEEADDRAIDRIKARIKEGTLAESEGQQKIAVILAEGFARRVKALQEEDQAYGTSLERRAAITDELIRLDGERTKSAEDAAARIVAAQASEAAADAGAGVGGAVGGAIGGLVQAPNEAIDAFGRLGEKISEVFGLGREGAEVFGGILTDAFSSLAQAVGAAVHAFVLFGGAGIGLKKFTATLIAEIARMAAVQAVWELAQGLAMLALNFFWPDPKIAASASAHFKAAAVYGGLALIAAAAGRAVAGGSFAQEGAGGGGSGGGGGRGSAGGGGTSGGPAVTDIDRRSVQRPEPVVNVLEFRVRGDAVVDAFTQDYDLNGRTRIKIISDR